MSNTQYSVVSDNRTRQVSVIPLVGADVAEVLNYRKAVCYVSAGCMVVPEYILASYVGVEGLAPIIL